MAIWNRHHADGIPVSELMAFIAASLVIIIVPGPDLTLALANTARSGRRYTSWGGTGIREKGAVILLCRW